MAATNLPKHNVDPSAAPAAPAVTSYSGNTVVTPQVAYSYLPYAVNYRYRLAPGQTGLKHVQEVAPLYATAQVQPKANVAEVATAPVAAPAPAVAVPAVGGSQYHAQDEAGQYKYGYSNQLSSKQETRTADGVVRGSYSYIDANGQVQSVNYISDVLGFRAIGTNFPTDDKDSVIQPQVAYSYLPYATNHPYYY